MGHPHTIGTLRRRPWLARLGRSPLIFWRHYRVSRGYSTRRQAVALAWYMTLLLLARGPTAVYRMQPDQARAFDPTFGWWSFWITAWQTDYFGKLLVLLFVLALLILIGIPIWLTR